MNPLPLISYGTLNALAFVSQFSVLPSVPPLESGFAYLRAVFLC